MEVRRLESLLLDIDADLTRWERAREDAERRVAEAEGALTAVVEAQRGWEPTAGAAFEMSLDGVEARDRGEAARLLVAWVRADRGQAKVCRLGGAPVTLAVRTVRGKPILVLSAQDVAETEVDVLVDELEMRGVGLGLIRRFEGRLRRLPELEGRIERERAAAAAEAARAGDEFGRLRAQRDERSRDLHRSKVQVEVQLAKAAEPAERAAPDGRAQAVAAVNFPRPRSAERHRPDVDAAQRELVAAHERVSVIRSALDARERTDGFAMVVGDVETGDRAQAAELVAHSVRGGWERDPTRSRPLGRLYGIDIDAAFRYRGAEPYVFLSVGGVNEAEVGIPIDSAGLDLIEALERQIATLPERLEGATAARAAARARLDARRQAAPRSPGHGAPK